MNLVVSLQEYALRKNDVLVLVDMHEALGAADEKRPKQHMAHALAECRLALGHSRARELPVAFVRRRSGPLVADWQDGFTPRREDMLFERRSHSCYDSEPFSTMVEAAGGRFVMAGLFGETSCIATMIDAANRGHRVTFLGDASCSHEQAGFSSEDMHRAILSILRLYGAVISTGEWVGKELGLGAHWP